MSTTNGRPVRSLLKILAGALFVFLAISMAQEWDVFRPWIMRESRDQGPPKVEPAKKRAAEAAVRGFLSLSGHFYASGGDTRFTDRMPAAPWVIEEMRRDVVYLGRNGRIQDQQLMGLTVESVEPAPKSAVVVRTKEYWVIRTLFVHRQDDSDPVRSEVLHCRYSVVQQGADWIVQAWEVEEERAAGTPREATAGNSPAPAPPPPPATGSAGR